MPSNSELVSQLYAGYFDRAPDPTGLAYWIDRANAGMSLTNIAQSFAVQPEASPCFGGTEPSYNFYISLSGVRLGSADYARDRVKKCLLAHRWLL